MANNTTRPTSADQKIKRAINGTLKEQALEALDHYIDAAKKESNSTVDHSLEFYVHVLLRAGDNEDDYGYKPHEANFLHSIIKAVQAMLADPKCSRQFAKLSGHTAQHISEALEKLRWFTEELQSGLPKALVTRYDLVTYGESLTEKDLYNLKITYQREAEISESRTAAIQKYLPLFRS